MKTKTEDHARAIVAKRKESERHKRIATLMQAAKQVFIAKGYDQASLREIALAAEFTTGAIYVYFSGKAELYGRILEQIMDMEISYLEEAAAVEGSILERLEAFAGAHIRFDIDFPEESALLAKNLDALDLPTALRRRLDSKIAKSLSYITDVIHQGIQKGFFPENLNKDEAAFLLFSATEGLSYTTTYGYSLEFEFDPLTLVKKAVRCLVSGMKANDETINRQG